jgi:hypothetical protein
MAMEAHEYYVNAMKNADSSGRFTRFGVIKWDSFPFEQTQLHVVPFHPPVPRETEREGQGGGRDCPACTTVRASIWADHHWRLSVLEPSGAPLVLILEPLVHHDLIDLTDELACEMGLLLVRVAQAIESLPNIARAHVSRWGDESAHLHIVFFARPSGFPQLGGRYLAIWERLLPSVPSNYRNRDASAIAQAITRTYGGRAVV